jgi:hypothetical protein
LQYSKKNIKTTIHPSYSKRPNQIKVEELQKQVEPKKETTPTHVTTPDREKQKSLVTPNVLELIG